MFFKKGIMCDNFFYAEKCKQKRKMVVFLLTSSSKNNLENPRDSWMQKIQFLTFNIQVYRLALRGPHIVGRQAGVVALVVSLDVLDGQTVACDDNSSVYVLMDLSSLHGPGPLVRVITIVVQTVFTYVMIPHYGLGTWTGLDSAMKNRQIQ